MAPDATVAGEVLDAARDAGVLFVHGVWSRFFPAMARLREIIDSGAIGTVRSARASFCQNDDEPYDVVSQALRGGQPELRKRLFQEGQMPCEPKQYPQESYNDYSIFILSSIHEGASKSSNLSRDAAELLVQTTVIEPTRRHSAPEEYSPKRIIKLPRSDSDRTVKISNSDSSSSPALGPDDCSARAVSDGSIKAANASDISQKPVDDLDLVCHDIESVDGSKDSSDDHMSSVYELLKSCSMTDVATESEQLSAGESNLSCKKRSFHCRRRRSSIDMMREGLGKLSKEFYKPSIFGSSKDENSSCSLGSYLLH